MWRLLGRRARRVVLAAVALFAAAAGIAYATIPDGNGVYTACMLNKVGTVRLIDPSLPASNLMSHCTSFETQITFNKQGPQGLPGPAGTSDGYKASNYNPTGAGGTQSASLTLPAGKYVISAKAVVAFGSGGGALCELTTGNVAEKDHSTASGNGSATLSNETVTDLPSGGTVQEGCVGPPPDGVVANVVITAISVDTVHEQ